jgi:hypothetical protein
MVLSVMGSIKLTVAVVGNPRCDRRTEWVSKKTSPGAPNTVMVDIWVLRLLACSDAPSFKFKPL